MSAREQKENLCTDIYVFERVSPKPPKSYEEYEYMFRGSSEYYGSWKIKKKGRKDYEEWR